MINRPGQHLWRALESVRGLCTSHGEWRSLLADDYERASKILRPTGTLARSCPCPARPLCGCIHRVVRHADARIVGACECESRRCPSHPLTRDAIALHRIDVASIGASIASTMGISSQFTVVRDVPSTWQVGVHSPCAGFRIPVYMMLHAESDAIRHAIDALVARATGAFVLLTPTRDLIAPDLEAVLLRANAHLATLSDEFVLLASGAITSRRPIDQVLKPVLDRVLPQDAARTATAFFPTPPFATWPEVRIQFRDSHTVAVRVGDAQGIFNFAQMGMANARNNAPTLQWNLLHAFAEGHGALDWSSSGAHRRNQKQKDALSAKLAQFFRIEGAPFEVTPSTAGRGKGWKTRFALDP